MGMQMLTKLFALRTAVAALLALVVLANLAFVNYHELGTKITHSLESLDAAIGQLMLDDYAAQLKDDLVALKKADLLADIRKELELAHKDSLMDEIRHKLEDDVRVELKEEYRRKHTSEYARLSALSFAWLDELKARYYKENEGRVKNLALFEALNNVLHDDPGSDALKKKVAHELDSAMLRKLWFDFVLRDIIGASKPDMGPLTDDERGADIRGCARVAQNVIYNREMLSRVRFSEERMADFKTKHAGIEEKLRMMDVPPPHIFSGPGIVLSAGGAYMAGALVTIVQVRETGSELPIEVMLNSRSEYDEHICTTMGAKLNFRCVVIEDEIGKEVLEELNITKFQLKILGLLVTSFDHVIALDADNMPLKNPDALLTLPEYLRTRFVLWPDLWQRTISPTYYNIAGIAPGEIVRRHGIKNTDDFLLYAKRGTDNAHFHDLDGLPNAASTETGQMVFSKREHFRSFILALYYNVYADHYWRLFYQGSPGAGDRDTFVPALHVFNEPYHVVEHKTWLAGFNDHGFFQETTIVQYDPTTSAAFGNGWREWLSARGMDLRLPFDQANHEADQLLKEFKQHRRDLGKEIADPEVLFLHIHRPKINPVLATDPEGYFSWNKQRNLGLPGAYKNHWGNTDWDLRFYTISKWVACSGIKSDSWWKSVDRNQAKVCEEMTKYVDWLKEDSNDPDAQKFTHVKLD